MSLVVNLSSNHYKYMWRPTTTDRELQKRIEQRYVAYTYHPFDENRYWDLKEHFLDFKKMRQIRKDDETRCRELYWQIEEETGIFDDFDESDTEELGLDSGLPEEKQHCPTNCNKPKRQCLKVHRCLKKNCAGGGHWAPAVDFNYFQGGSGNRQKGCTTSNANSAAWMEEAVFKPGRERCRKEAAEAGISSDTDLPQKIALGKAIIDSATDGFSRAFDIYIYVASLGANNVTLHSEAVSTIFTQTNSNTPILRTLQYDPDAPKWGNGIIPHAERREAATDSHVFELGDTGFDLQGGDDLEKAMQDYGEQVVAASGGRIKKLWRRRGAGGPKSGGPYKVGLIVIERNADSTLGPRKWVRIDEF